jgi:hypothetical protein
MVTKEVLISFSIEKYKDKVLCDVVPMHASHLLLPSMMNLKIGILLRKMEVHTHLYHCHLDRHAYLKAYLKLLSATIFIQCC